MVVTKGDANGKVYVATAPGGSVLVDQKTHALDHSSSTSPRSPCLPVLLARIADCTENSGKEKSQGPAGPLQGRQPAQEGGPQGLLGEPRRGPQDLRHRTARLAAGRGVVGGRCGRCSDAARGACGGVRRHRRRRRTAAGAGGTGVRRGAPRVAEARPRGGRGDGGGHQVRREDHQHAHRAPPDRGCASSGARRRGPARGRRARARRARETGVMRRRVWCQNPNSV